MPTNNKTPNLQLNSWIGTDKPMRSDFVSDNTILDTTIYNHTSNSNIHLTSAEKTWIGTPYDVNGYAGSGSDKQIVFTYSPKAIIVFRKGKPLSYYDAENEYMVHNSAVVLPGNVSSKGATLVGTVLTLTQTQSTPSDGHFYNLSELNGQYGLIALK